MHNVPCGKSETVSNSTGNRVHNENLRYGLMKKRKRSVNSIHVHGDNKSGNTKNLQLQNSKINNCCESLIAV